MILELVCRNGVVQCNDQKTQAEIEKVPFGGVIQVEYKKESKGSQSMLNTWWWWMQETADYMHGRGCTMPLYFDSKGVAHGKRRFNRNDAHELFTIKWLGTDENGNRLSWSRDKKHPEKTIADSGQRHHALSQHDAYCTDRGISITIPIKSEYREFMSHPEFAKYEDVGKDEES